MKELYGNELPLGLRMLGAWRMNSDSVDFKWGYFAPRLGFEIMLARGGYFDRRYALTVCLIWGVFHFYLPFKTSIPESCDTPRYGVQIHSDTFWIHLGGKMNEMEQCDSKWITWDLPFFHWVFRSHEVWTGAGWVPASGDYREPYKDNRLIEKHPYRYTLKSGEIQEREATIYMERRRWTRKWFPFLDMIQVSIDIQFNDEVGEKTGTWKGGCVGCGWEMLPGESMEEALRRMEQDQKF